MIAYIGNMSGGKTYTAMRDLLYRLSNNHIIVTNIKLNCQGVTEYLSTPCVFWKKNYFFLSEDDDELKKFQTIKISEYEKFPIGSLRGSKDYEASKVYIYLDEISSVFDAMTSSNSQKIQQLAIWARHTEKRGQIVSLIMQFPSELHKRLRNHVTEYIACINSSKIRIPFLKTKLPWFLRGLIINTIYSSDGETIIGNSTWHSLDSRVYHCYYTGQIVYGSIIGQDISPTKLQKVYKVNKCPPLFILLIVLQVIISLFGLYVCFG